MILKSKSSKLSIVNLLSDYILSQIPKEEESIIQVVDCNNFYVIKGKTTHNEPLDIVKIKDEFISKYEELLGERKLSHTIDLIEYDSKINKVDHLSFTLHNNNKNCSYHYKQIESFIDDDTNSYDFDLHIKTIDEDKSLIFCSEFPHGYSLNQGRLLYYYGKHIFYNIPKSYPVSSLIFELTTKKNEDDEQVLSVITPSFENDNILESAILDVFDFNMNWLETEIKKVDWSTEITNPLEDYNFLKKKIKDFIIF
jgi:hypothetical protein